MTTRKKNPVTGEVELTKISLIPLLLSTQGFRLVLIVLVLTMHPVGRQLLGTFGFEFPDQRKLTVATEEAKTNAVKIDSAVVKLDAVVKTVDELKSDVTEVKRNNAIINTKVDNLDRSFTGFQIDFNRYKTGPGKEPKDTTTEIK